MAHEPDETLAALQQPLSALVRRTAVPRAHQRLAAYAGVDIAPVEAVVLGRIVDERAMRVSDLAQWLGVVCSTASRHTTQLAKQGLCERATDPVDGRAVIVHATDAGRAVVARLRDAQRALLHDCLADWTTADRRDLARLLTRFVDALEGLTEPVRQERVSG